MSTNLQQESLPSLSAYSYPLTNIRQDSILVKRNSYSSNLKKIHAIPSKLDVFGKINESCRESTCSRCGISKDIRNDNEWKDDNNMEQWEIYFAERSKKRKNPVPESLISESFRLRSNCVAQSEHMLKELPKKLSKSYKGCSVSARNISNAKSRTKLVGNTRVIGKPLQKERLSIGELFINLYGKKNRKNKQCCKEGKSKFKPDLKKEKVDQQHDIDNEDPKDNLYHNQKPIFSRKLKPIELGCTNKQLKNRKVYYSEKQSVKVGSIPGVPPSTPNESLVGYVASLSDIKSQRDIRQRLRKIKSKQEEREKAVQMTAKPEDIELKMAEKKILFDIQRRQIYAINYLLANLEKEKFLKFKNQTKGVPV